MLKVILLIVKIIIILSIIIFFILYLYKRYKASKTIGEKVAFLLIMLFFTIPMIIYYFDRNNIFSKLNWIVNTSSDRWFNFLETYISSAFGALIGAVALVLMTMYQMNRQDEKDKENVRINNMPLLSYKISRNKGKVIEDNFIATIFENGIIIDFELEIKNVGMNAIKKSFVKFSSEDFCNSYYNWLENNGCINKNEDVSIYRFLVLSEGKHIINFTIYYCDLINNWYCQNVVINLEITNYFDNIGNIYSSNLIIEDEKLLKEDPKDLINKI